MSEGQAPPKEEAAPREPSEVNETRAESGNDHSTRQADAIKPAQAIGDYPNLKVRSMIETGTYEVLHLKGGGGSTSYRVNLKDMTCTCPDWEFNRDTHQPCKHMAAALLDGAPQQWDVDRGVLRQIAYYDNRVTAALDKIERLTTGLQADASAAQSGGTAGGGSDTGSTGEDPQEAADRLQDAYDEVVNDMQVKSTDSYVWVQTGQDTPENLPGPGSASVFQALLQNPEQVEFVPDDYNGDYPNAGSEKPGEWWKNCLAPEDVDGYVSEVLQG